MDAPAARRPYPVQATAGVGLVTRRWLTLTIGWTPARRRWVIAAVLVLLVLLEVRQQLRADLLMASTTTWP